MTETILCEICYERLARPGMKTCWTCNGFPDRDEENKEMKIAELDPKPSPLKSFLGHCETCGTSFEPYKNGKIDILTVCHTCLMKRKYGPDWTPGDKREKDRLRAAEQRRKLREAKDAEKGCPIPNEPEPSKPTPYPDEVVFFRHITVPFDDTEDEGLFNLIMSTAKRERRTPHAQILYWLDRVVEGV